MRRIVFVMKKFRRFMQNLRRRHQSFACDEARKAFLKIKLTKNEFVECGGHKTVSGSINCFSYYRQLVAAKRDMEEIMRKGRFNKSKSLPPPGYISSDTEGEEDVDKMDAAAHDGMSASGERMAQKVDEESEESEFEPVD